MATINDLPIPDFSNLSDDELQDLILQTRSRRRNPPKEVKEASIKKAVAKKKKGKAVALKNPLEMLKGLSPEQAAQLLKTLNGGK